MDERIKEIKMLINEKIKQTGNDGSYNFTIVTNEWENYGKHRLYFYVIETRANSKHYIKYDFGYIDLINEEYVAGKMDAMDKYNLSGEIMK